MWIKIERVIFALLVLGLIWWAMGATTPDKCKVPLDKMSQDCKNFLYP
jgi:hypothetical protein